MRRRRADNAMSLDSLLDTVTNVVGFLVIILAVVQLNVVYAPGLTTPPIPPRGASRNGNEQQKKDEMSKKLKKDLKELRNRLAALLNQIEQKKGAIENTRVGMARTEKGTIDNRIVNLLAEMEKIKEKIKNARRDLADLGRKKGAAQRGITAAQAPRKETIPNIRIVEVYTPGSGNPKPAWVTKKQIWFVCRKGRVFRLNSERLDKLLIDNIRRCLRTPRGKKIVLTSQEAKKIVRYFDSHRICDKYVRIKIEYIDFGFTGSLVAIYKFRNDRNGETAAAIRTGQSQFERYLRGQSPRKAWVRFFVWNDSFELYRRLRKITERDCRFDVGWRPFDKNQEFRISLSGGSGGGTGPGT